MNRIFLVFTIVFLLFSTISCKQGNDIQTPISNLFYDKGEIGGDYIFKAGYTRIRNFNPLLKYNIHTGECSFVCTDPFCDHKTEKCFFYDVKYYVNIGNTLYLERYDESKGKYGLYEFNVDKESGEFVYHSEKRIDQIMQYGYYIYFKDIGKGNFMRMDMHNRSLSEIKTTIEMLYLYNIANSKIFWNAPDGKNKQGEKIKQYIVTDLDGNYIETTEYITMFEDYLYKLEKYEYPDIGYKSFHLNILCKRIGEEDYSMIKENTGPITVFRDKLIGFLPPDNLNIAADAHTWRDNEFTGIWVSDPDGGNTKVLINDEERKLHIQSMSGDRSNELTCGDYIGIILNPETEINSEEENLPDCELLIINIYTGEYVVSRPQFD